MRAVCPTLRAPGSVPPSLPKEFLSGCSVLSYGPKKPLLGRVWQQSCAARRHAGCLSATYNRFIMSLIVVNIIPVIGHNLLANYGLTRHDFRCYNPGMGKKPVT